MAEAKEKRSYETVLAQTENSVTTVTLNRPEKKNAMSPQMHRDMSALLAELRYDDETRVIVITGAGESFCAGQDLKQYFVELDKLPASERDEVKRLSGWRGDGIRNMPKPVVAMVNGWCFGGAFTIITSCDIVIADQEAIFGLSEVNFGFFPGGEVTKVLTEHLQAKHALYYSMTGKPFDGKEAERIGLITKAVPGAELEKETQEVVDSLLEKDPLALQAVKEAWHNSVTAPSPVAHKLAMLMAESVKNKQGGRPGIKQFTDKKYRPGLDSYKWEKS